MLFTGRTQERPWYWKRENFMRVKNGCMFKWPLYHLQAIHRRSCDKVPIKSLTEEKGERCIMEILSRTTEKTSAEENQHEGWSKKSSTQKLSWYPWPLSNFVVMTICEPKFPIENILILLSLAEGSDFLKIWASWAEY